MNNLPVKLKLVPAPWMDYPGLKTILETLGDGLVVGGAVRSAILGEDLSDIDIATPLTPSVVTQKLEAAGIKVVPTGLDHGTVTAVIDHQGFEITTLRRDVETDGRRAVVAFTENWLEDAQRRDFTMNTLLMDINGQVFDPTGTGIEDLKNGVVRFVGDPDTRIAEDALRILRFFRFHARYGKGAPDENGFQACAHNVRLIANLSRERITTEFEKLLQAPGAATTIPAMTKAGILADLIKSDFSVADYDLLRAMVVKPESQIPRVILLMYCITSASGDFSSEVIEKYLVLSNRKKEYLKDCSRFLKQYTDLILKNIYIFGKDVTLGGSILFNILNAKSRTLKELQVLVEDISNAPQPILPLKAEDLMKHFSLKPGKALGEVLKRTEAWWLEKNTQPDHAACLAHAKTLL